jgi:hypothetical protein
MNVEALDLGNTPLGHHHTMSIDHGSTPEKRKRGQRSDVASRSTILDNSLADLWVPCGDRWSQAGQAYAAPL